MRTILGYLPLIVVLTIGILAIAFSRPLSRWITKNREVSVGAKIGKLTHVEGSVRRIHGSEIELIPVALETPPDLRDGDTIQSSVSSKADLILGSVGQYEVPEGSGIQFNRWNPEDENSPIYIRIVFGRLNQPAQVARNDVYVIQNRKLYLASQKPTDRPIGMSVTRSPPVAEIPRKPFTVSPVQNINPDMLSLEYIDATILDNRSKIQKCWLANSAKKAHLQVQFEISKVGEVAKPQIENSSGSDDSLEKCVVNAFSQILFRPYSGTLISQIYPIDFE